MKPEVVTRPPLVMSSVFKEPLSPTRITAVLAHSEPGLAMTARLFEALALAPRRELLKLPIELPTESVAPLVTSSVALAALEPMIRL